MYISTFSIIFSLLESDPLQNKREKKTPTPLSSPDVEELY